jgi:hypothetical protein
VCSVDLRKRIAFLIMCCDIQIGEDKSLVAEAHEHILVAGELIARAGESKDLTRRFKEAKASVAAMEVWAKACEAGELALQKGKEALESGDIDRASGHCQQVRLVLDAGFKCQSLRGAFKVLEQAVKSGQ